MVCGSKRPVAGVFAFQAADRGDDVDQMLRSMADLGQLGRDAEALFVFGIAVKRHDDACALEFQSGLLGRRHQQDWRFVQRDHLLGLAAKQPAAQPALAVRAHHDQIGRQIADVLDNAARHIVNFHRVDVAVHDHVGRESHLRDGFEISAGLGGVRQMPIVVDFAGRVTLDHVQQRNARRQELRQIHGGGQSGFSQG